MKKFMNGLFKTVGIVVLSFIALLFVIATVNGLNGNTGTKTENKQVKTESSKQAKSWEPAETKKIMTQDEYDNLQVGNVLNGIGGANMDDIVKTYKQTGVSTSTQVGNLTMKTISIAGENNSVISLSFYSQADGSYLLSTKSSFSY